MVTCRKGKLLMEKEELKKKLSPLAYRVTQENGTEALLLMSLMISLKKDCMLML